MTRIRKIPSYRLHKPTGQAVVRLNGKDHYLGKHGTDASNEAYHRLIGEWLATGQHRTPEPVSQSAITDLSINEFILAFYRHAEKHYRGPDGQTTREVDNLRAALRPVRNLYGTSSACRWPFSRLKLRACSRRHGQSRTLPQRDQRPRQNESVVRSGGRCPSN